MSGAVPLRALSACVLPYGQANRYVLVLKAFFDDSGTHANSDVVAMGGLLADEESWARLEAAWADERDRLGIKKMHMASCENARKDFAGWSRPDRDAAIESFAAVVRNLGGVMLGAAVARATWVEAISEKPILGDAFADPIDFCFNACMRHAMEWHRKAVGPEPVAVTFDSREESLSVWKPRAAGYQQLWPEKVAGFSFGSMAQVLPLQAADMIAYEVFVFQCHRERAGAEPPPRANFARLIDALGPPGGGFFTAAQLIAYAGKLEAGLAAGRG